MKKPPSRIREEIAKLQEQLRQAEAREAERIGRIALKAGLGEIELGGLIVKAGLRYETRALLLGALIELGERLQLDEGERPRLTAIGAEAFRNGRG
ncbi:TraC family protein [Sinorhizobium sp. GL28]|uniref:TraC family protein n=1 Tax=Sinorhizobium sp. GL28 TaxID=1358418 RepID=UPI00072C1E3E|nr:TraC family protein [Sinorhizobium sp. GL28]KSV86144.1 hypothetical protein N184_32495 [Sinorhizobium sp. GL28]